MSKTIYFAHPVWTYDTDTEAAIVAALEAEGYTVVNPNAQEHHAAYAERGMGYFTELVVAADELCWLGEDDNYWSAMSGGHDVVGAGVAKEILEAIVHGKTIHFVSQDKKGWHTCSTSGMPDIILSIDATRARRAFHMARRAA